VKVMQRLLLVFVRMKRREQRFDREAVVANVTERVRYGYRALPLKLLSDIIQI